jgi:hypothetical protein
MSTRTRVVVAVVVVALAVAALLVITLRPDKHEATAPRAAPQSSTTRPVTHETVRASTPSVPSTTASAPTPTTTLPTIVLPPFTSAQLELALLQSDDLPSGSRRDVVPPEWGGVCGSTPPAFAAPISGAAVDYEGPEALHVREDLADYGDNTAGYLAAVQARVACATYLPDGKTGGPPTTVLRISPTVLAAGLDTRNGAEGVGVETVDGQGHPTFHIWVRQGKLVISLLDDARTATPVSAVQLAQLALERVKNTLA